MTTRYHIDGEPGEWLILGPAREFVAHTYWDDDLEMDVADWDNGHWTEMDDVVRVAPVTGGSEEEFEMSQLRGVN